MPLQFLCCLCTNCNAPILPHSSSVNSLVCLFLTAWQSQISMIATIHDPFAHFNRLFICFGPCGSHQRIRNGHCCLRTLIRHVTAHSDSELKLAVLLELDVADYIHDFHSLCFFEPHCCYVDLKSFFQPICALLSFFFVFSSS